MRYYQLACWPFDVSSCWNRVSRLSSVLYPSLSINLSVSTVSRFLIVVDSSLSWSIGPCAPPCGALRTCAVPVDLIESKQHASVEPTKPICNLSSFLIQVGDAARACLATSLIQIDFKSGTVERCGYWRFLHMCMNVDFMAERVRGYRCDVYISHTFEEYEFKSTLQYLAH